MSVHVKQKWNKKRAVTTRVGREKQKHVSGREGTVSGQEAGCPKGKEQRKAGLDSTGVSDGSKSRQ